MALVTERLETLKVDQLAGNLGIIKDDMHHTFSGACLRHHTCLASMFLDSLLSKHEQIPLQRTDAPPQGTDVFLSGATIDTACDLIVRCATVSFMFCHLLLLGPLHHPPNCQQLSSFETS